MPNGHRPGSTSSVIELMTAWLDSPDGPPDLMIDCLVSQLDSDSARDNLFHAVEPLSPR